MGTRHKALNRPICKSLIAYPTKGDVVRALQNLHKKGRPINYRAIVKSNPVLKSASRIHFGCWNDTLTAAGFDPDEIMKRPKWTKKSLIETIRDLDSLDIPLNTTSVSKVKGGLPEACVKQFGSWDNALHAAGYDPKQIRVNRQPWTKDSIINHIRHCAENGLPYASSTILPASIRPAARRLLGSWTTARLAAGVPKPNVQPKCRSLIAYPSPDDVIRNIQKLYKEGRPINCRAIRESNTVLRNASLMHFGSWDNALVASGFDPEKVSKNRTWNKNRVIKKIQNRKERNISLNLTTVIKIDCGLVRASIKRFGCWDNALLAAGYDPEQIRVNRRVWTRDSIINHIRHCIDTGLPCTVLVQSCPHPSYPQYNASLELGEQRCVLLAGLSRLENIKVGQKSKLWNKF